MTCKTLTYLKMVPALACLGLSAMTVSARTAMKDIFVNSPRDIFTTIDSITRVEMVLYNEAGSETMSKNLFGGPCRIDYISDTELKVKTSPASSTDLYRLPAAKGDSVILAVTSVSLPAVDSHATMYSADWKELPAKMQLPSVNDLDVWLTDEGKERRREVENAVPFVPALFVYSSATCTLVVDSSIRQLIGKDNYEQISSCLKKAISYRWDGRKWKQLAE